jgi:hypothetical protein
MTQTLMPAIPLSAGAAAAASVPPSRRFLENGMTSAPS